MELSLNHFGVLVIFCSPSLKIEAHQILRAIATWSTGLCCDYYHVPYLSKFELYDGAVGLHSRTTFQSIVLLKLTRRSWKKQEDIHRVCPTRGHDNTGPDIWGVLWNFLRKDTDSAARCALGSAARNLRFRS